MRGVAVLVGSSAVLLGSPAIAGFVPIATSYAFDATATVSSPTLALTDTRAVSLTSPAMFGANVAFDEFRTATARMRLNAADAGSEQMARYAGGVSGSANAERISSTSWTQGRHDGVMLDGVDVTRTVDVIARVRFEFAVQETTQYQFFGMPGGQSEQGPFDGLPISDVVVAFWAPSGVLHEFHNIDFQRSATGGFDVAGSLTPGIYTIDAITRVRMGLGSIPANDPYTAFMQFDLVAVPGPGPLAMVGLALFAGSRRKR